MTGHMMGAAGAFEAFATVLSVAEQTVPATINYRDRDPEVDLNIPTETRAAPDPLGAVQQHRPGRPQRRRHLQALRRRLTAPGAEPVPSTARIRTAHASRPEVIVPQPRTPPVAPS